MHIKKILALIILTVPLLWSSGCEKKAPTLKIGQALPDVMLKDGNGTDVRLSSLLSGKVGILLFWEKGCPYCKREMPRLEPLYAAYRNSGVIIIGVHVGQGSDAIAQAVQNNSLTFPMLEDPSAATRRLYGLVAVPSIFFTEKDGTVSEKILGGLPAEDLEMLIKEKL